VQELYLAMAALAPEQDWTWIRKIERRLRTTARSVRNKRIRLVSSEQLLSLGLEPPMALAPIQRWSKGQLSAG